MAGSDRSREGRLLAELLGGATIRDAATTSGMSERTARRHLAKPELRAELDEWRRSVVAGVVASLADLADLALEAQRSILEDAEAPPAVRRQVARDVLDALRELGQGRDLEERFERLEQKLGIDPRTHWKAA